MKCESLVHSRILIDPKTKLRTFVKLRDAEPCGADAMMYEIRAKKRYARRGKDDKAQLKFMGVSAWYIETGVLVVKQSLCDKHRKKAEREGKLTESLD